MAVRASLGLLCGALTASGAEGGFVQAMLSAFRQEEPRFVTSGRQLLVDGRPMHLKGVVWSPVPVGGLEEDMDRDGFVERDSSLMAEAGINVVRMRKPLLNTTTLDTLLSKNIYVINMAYADGGDALSLIPPRINAVRDHPAILAWEVGNNWNDNYFYYKTGEHAGGNIDTYEQARQRAIDAVSIVKTHDKVHPVVTVYAGLPSADTLSMLPEVDIWGLSYWPGDDFGLFFREWSMLSGKPMYVAGYGADAFDAREGFAAANESAQAYAVRALTEQITTHTSVTGGVCLGGMIYELVDEWWRAGNPDQHDQGGVAWPDWHSYPDDISNEEWWGLCEIDRTCRPAFDEYKAILIPTPPAPSVYWPQQATWGFIAFLALLTLCCYINRIPDLSEPQTEMS